MYKRIIIIFCCFVLLANACLAQQPRLMLPVGHSGTVLSASFSPDGTKVITVGSEGTAKLWEAETGKLLKEFMARGDASIAYVQTAEFIPGTNKVLIRFEHGQQALIWDMDTGKEEEIWNRNISVSQFSPDGKRVIMASLPGDSIIIYNTANYKPIVQLRDNDHSRFLSYSPDGKRIVSVSSPDDGSENGNSYIRLLDATTGRPLSPLKKLNDIVYSFLFSPDGKRILLSMDHSAVIADATTLRFIDSLRGYISNYGIGSNMLGDETVEFSPGGRIITQLGLSVYDSHLNETFNTPLKLYDSLTVWDAQTGNILYRLTGLTQQPGISFSPDGKKIILTDSSRVVKVRNMMTGQVLFELRGHKVVVLAAAFSPDGKRIVTASADGTAKLWDAATGAVVAELNGHAGMLTGVQYSKDGKKIVTASGDRTAKIWDALSAKELVAIRGKTNDLKKASFSADGRKINILTENGVLSWDFAAGKFSTDTSVKKESFSSEIPMDSLSGIYISPDGKLQLSWAVNIIYVEDHSTGGFFNFWNEEKEVYNDVRFSPDSKKLLATTINNTVKLIDIKTKTVLFTFIAVGNSDFLITDSSGRYDGTETARKLLHFACGDEVVGLEQVKDRLWIPGLAERIINGEPINAPEIEEIGICGLTPVVEKTESPGKYSFKIKPRKGGLGETVVLVNGIEALRYKSSQLKKASGFYELAVFKKDLNNWLVPGQENQVIVKAFTADNNISSRGGIVNVADSARNIAPPDLYAVMIGVSDYKGTEMDLNYAAKDADDLSAVLSAASKKLLNTDSAEHVYVYNLTTEKNRYQLPEKKAVQALMVEIGKKAKANDILMVFFAGHGLMAGEGNKKQFYFMTADASSLSATDAVKETGISTNELTEWMKPQNIKAQKRVLIFDACNSGQAIKDFVKIGNDEQGFIAARNDDKAQQIKAIDKLNEKSGMFILSASASDKSAYESRVYEHGYLTYSLLKTIKERPDILEGGKYLNISRWFNAAAQTATEVAKQDRKSQEPQIVTNTDFTIGIVDEGVVSSINVTETKPLFTSGNFLNSNTADDDLDLRILTDKKLEALSGENNSTLIFYPSSGSPDAWSLTGSYSINESAVTIKVKLKKGKAVKHEFTETGTKEKAADLVTAIVSKAVAWAAANK